jgi:hypothetical protein
VAIEMSTWRARLWVRVMAVVAPFVGRERAMRWAIDGARSRLRFRLAGQRRWSRLP